MIFSSLRVTLQCPWQSLMLRAETENKLLHLH